MSPTAISKQASAIRIETMPYQLPDPQARPPLLDPSRVPPAVRAWIPLAEKYGIGDDFYREEVLVKLDLGERTELVRFLEESPDELWDWLAGPESHEPKPSPEYLTFSCLALAAESAKANSDLGE